MASSFLLQILRVLLHRHRTDLNAESAGWSSHGLPGTFASAFGAAVGIFAGCVCSDAALADDTGFAEMMVQTRLNGRCGRRRSRFRLGRGRHRWHRGCDRRFLRWSWRFGTGTAGAERSDEAGPAPEALATRTTYSQVEDANQHDPDTCQDSGRRPRPPPSSGDSSCGLRSTSPSTGSGGISSTSCFRLPKLNLAMSLHYCPIGIIKMPESDVNVFLRSYNEAVRTPFT